MSDKLKEMIKSIEDSMGKELPTSVVDEFARLQDIGIESIKKNRMDLPEYTIHCLVEATLRHITEPGNGTMRIAVLDTEKALALVTSSLLVGIGLAIDEEIR